MVSEEWINCYQLSMIWVAHPLPLPNILQVHLLSIFRYFSDKSTFLAKHLAGGLTPIVYSRSIMKTN